MLHGLLGDSVGREIGTEDHDGVAEEEAVISCLCLGFGFCVGIYLSKGWLTYVFQHTDFGCDFCEYISMWFHHS